MAHIRKHWTSDSHRDFLYRIAFDFVAQLEAMMESGGVKPLELARRLGVSKGRVSQILNNPGNITLKTAIEYARALGVKVALVAYADDDANNDDGPVNPQVFATCWEKAGKPTDLLSPETAMATASEVVVNPTWKGYDDMAATTEKRLRRDFGLEGIEDHAGTTSSSVIRSESRQALRRVQRLSEPSPSNNPANHAMICGSTVTATKRWR